MRECGQFAFEARLHGRFSPLQIPRLKFLKKRIFLIPIFQALVLVPCVSNETDLDLAALAFVLAFNIGLDDLLLLGTQQVKCVEKEIDLQSLRSGVVKIRNALECLS